MEVFKTTVKYLPLIICLTTTLLFTSYAQDALTSDKVKQLVDSSLSECQNNPGCVAGIYQNGKKLYTTGFGLANLEYNIPTTTNTVFEVGGLSMHFTAACIIMLEKEGLISLDDPIQKHLPEFPDYKEGVITIRNLLDHTSGIRDFIVLLIASGKSLNSPYNNSDAVQLLSKQKALCTIPNTEYRFSHSNYLLLAEIIESASKISLGEYAQKTLFSPAGMGQTLVYDNSNRVIKNRAIAYSSSGDTVERNTPLEFVVNGAGRVYSTMEDFSKWISFLKSHQVGEQSMLEKLSTARDLPNGTQMTYALGLENGLFNGNKLVAHNGYWAGFSAMYLNFPDQNLDIVVMSSNGNVSAPVKAYDLAEALIPPIDSPGGNEVNTGFTFETLSKHQLRKYEGQYFDPKYAYKRETYIENDTLRLEINPNVKRTLIPISKNEFWISGQAKGTTVRFQGSGNQMLTTVEGNLPHTYERYSPTTYTIQELNSFSGQYYAEELGVSYEVRVVNNELRTFIDNQELVVYTSVMQDTFTSAHDGYIAFTRGKNGIITGFQLTDYSLGTISFRKQTSNHLAPSGQ